MLRSLILSKVFSCPTVLPVAVLTLSETTTVKTVMAAKKDVDKASAFCRAVGNPVDASIPGATARQSVGTSFYLPTNPVSFSGIAELQVDPASNRVVSYWNTALSRTYQLQRKPAGVGVSEAVARTSAAAAVKEAGQNGEIGEATVRLQWLSQDHEAGDGSWWMQSQRMFQGIPYRDDNLVVWVDLETGLVGGLSANFKTLPPTTVKTSVSRDVAITQASAILDTDYHGRYTLHWANLYIVGQNGQWLHGDTATRYDRPGKVAWVCAYTIPSGPTNPAIGPRPLHAQVWVDAQTGQIIGGSRSTWR